MQDILDQFSMELINPKSFRLQIKKVRENDTNVGDFVSARYMTAPFAYAVENAIQHPFVELADAFTSNTSVKRIIIMNDPYISLKGINRFLRTIGQRPNITFCDFRKLYSSKKTKSVKYSWLIEGNTTLNALSVSESYINDEDAVDFARELKHNNTLKYLDLENITTSKQNFQLLLSAVTDIRSLFSFSFSGNKFCLSLATSLKNLFSTNHTLSSIFLRRCDISDEVLVELGKGLRVNFGITNLSLEENCITDQGVCDLLAEIKHNTVLSRLNLEENQLTDQSLVYFGEYISQNTPLNTLVLRQDTFTGEGLKHLVEPLSCNTHLKNLCVESGIYDIEDIDYLFNGIVHTNYTLVYTSMIPCLPGYQSKKRIFEQKMYTEIGERNAKNQKERSRTLLNLLLPTVAYPPSSFSNQSNTVPSKHLL